MAEETVFLFVARCPLGEQCSKKGGILAKSPDEEKVRQAIAWHLQASPYHELTKEKAEHEAAVAELDGWEVSKSELVQDDDDEANWYANRSKGHKPRRKPASPRRSRSRSRSRRRRGSASTDGRRGSASTDRGGVPAEFALMRFSHKGTAGNPVSDIDIRSCVDALRRAKNAADTAASLCSKASRAFTEEGVVIGNCMSVLESYLV